MQYNIQEFERDFMARTRILLDSYAGVYDATMLLNCMVGLLIVPQQHLLYQIPDDNLENLEEWGIQRESILCIGRDGGHDLSACSLRWLARKLRNAVAHFHISPVQGDAINSNGVVGYEFWDRSGFRAILRLEEIQTFCKQIAENLCQQPTDPNKVSTKQEDAEQEDWKRGAKLYITFPERVYVVDCPGLCKRSYEICSSAAEYYIAGCDKTLLTHRATDYVFGVSEQERRQWLFDKTALLVGSLPKNKRLSIYTNDSELPDTIRGELNDMAKTRLSHFEVYRIHDKRQLRCPPPSS